MADTEGEHEQRHHVRNHRHNLRRNSVPLKIDLYRIGKTEYQAQNRTMTGLYFARIMIATAI